MFLGGERGSALAYPVYALSAYTLTVICARVIKHAGHARESLRAAVDRIPIARRYLTDRDFKLRVSLCWSLVINLFYVVWKLAYGIWFRSVWFATLAGYYLLLTVMRFALLRYARANAFGERPDVEWRKYRFCGVVLLVVNMALTGVVIMVVREKEGFSYPQLLDLCDGGVCLL